MADRNGKMIKEIIDKLRKWHEIEECRTCECLQGALTQLGIDGGAEIREIIKNMLVNKQKMHECLGCDPCPPAEIFSSYLKKKQETEQTADG
ncbi:MAG: hypothetical protein ACE5WD_01715 [Candidatus Aminicenantia bacterium]